MTEDDYRRDLERLRKPDVEDDFRRNPDAGSSIKTVMFVCACVALALLAYFGFAASR